MFEGSDGGGDEEAACINFAFFFFYFVFLFLSSAKRGPIRSLTQFSHGLFFNSFFFFLLQSILYWEE